MMATYTRRQWLTLVVITVAQFCNALCISIQAPFYPAEAEAKGATPSQYGFVFGIYELVIFICCPIYGKYIDVLGVKVVNNTGIFIVSITCILFGFLDKIQNVTTFIAFSFIIRIIEGTGTSAFTTAAFSIVAKEFHDDVGSTFAALETFFGIGLILGPTVGGALYELGGFTLPFATVGGLLFVAGLLILVLLPSQDNELLISHDSKGMLALLNNAPIILGAVAVLMTSYSIGFVQATLEPHIRPLHLSPLEVGSLFIVNGAAYAISAPIWGRVTDRWLEPKIVTAIGSIFIIIAFILMGPAPFLPVKVSLPLIIIALIFHGLGMGAALVSSFSGFHKDSLALGFPDNISTYGIVSGLWTSAFALGAFIGPSAAGLLFDGVGFRWASQTVVLIHALLFIFSCILLCCGKKNRTYTVAENSDDNQRLLNESDATYTSDYGAIS